jgi:hypothetical protein
MIQGSKKVLDFSLPGRSDEGSGELGVLRIPPAKPEGPILHLDQPVRRSGFLKNLGSANENLEVILAQAPALVVRDDVPRGARLCSLPGAIRIALQDVLPGAMKEIGHD